MGQVFFYKEGHECGKCTAECGGDAILSFKKFWNKHMDMYGMKAMDYVQADKAWTWHRARLRNCRLFLCCAFLFLQNTRPVSLTIILYFLHEFSELISTWTQVPAANSLE